MKKKIIFSITVLLLSITVATTALFAWFTSGKAYISNIEFETGRIEMTVELYSISDFNRDGIPDYNAKSESGLYLSDIVNPPVGSDAGIVVKNALPGQIFSYRLIAKNLSTKPSVFALSMTSEQANSKFSLNDCFAFRASVGQTEYKVSLKGNNVVIIDEQDEADKNRIPIIAIPAKSTLTFDFQLSFEKLESLKTNSETASLFADKTHLNDYLGLDFGSCKFLFEFRQSESGAE